VTKQTQSHFWDDSLHRSEKTRDQPKFRGEQRGKPSSAHSPGFRRMCAKSPPRERWGNFLQSFDATALRGKQVRYRAWLRLEAPTLSGAQLLVRVDRPSGVGFHHYSLGEKIDSPDWTMREIVGKIDPDAVRISSRGTDRVSGPLESGKSATYTRRETWWLFPNAPRLRVK